MRIMIEVSEDSLNTISDSYVVSSFQELLKARQAELLATRGFISHEERSKLYQNWTKFYQQATEGKLAESDDMVMRVNTNTPGPIHYCFSILPTKSKHTK